MIPPDPLKVAEERLQRLKQLKKEIEDFSNQQAKQLDKDFREVNRWSQGVDAAATVLTTLTSLGFAVKDAHKAMSLTGKELAKANEKLVRTHVKGQVYDKADKLAGMAGSAMTITGEEGLAWAVTKVLLKSWSDMQSPSYWASFVVGESPEETYRKAKAHLAKMNSSMNKNLDIKISSTMKLISQLKAESTMPLPRVMRR